MRMRQRMRLELAAPLCLQLGCSGYPALPSVGPDAPADTPVVPSGRCDLDAPFGEVVLVPGANSEASDISASLSPDELTLYVSSTRMQLDRSYSINMGQRSTRTEPFGAFHLLTMINSSLNEQGPSISSDGLELYFSARPDGGDYNIYSSRRTSVTADFPAPALVAIVNSSADDGGPFITADGLELYFQSTQIDGKTRIFRATRPTTSTGFVKVNDVGELHAAGADENDPVVSADRKTIYFQSTRPDGTGGPDIYVAHRTTTTDGFGPSAPVAEINTAKQDWPLWLSPDGCRIYIGGDRPGGPGPYDIWVAEKPPL
jgi:Tol biopolymer transport system component